MSKSGAKCKPMTTTEVLTDASRTATMVAQALNMGDLAQAVMYHKKLGRTIDLLCLITEEVKPLNP
jgi:hypothetical protein